MVLVLGATVHVTGELVHSAGSWAVSYDLAPPHAQGHYQGMFGMTAQIASAITPLGASLLIVDGGWFGWLIFAAAFVLAGLAMPFAVRYGEPAAGPGPCSPIETDWPEPQPSALR
ncbi:hypothetical protein [Micromonospora psammae]|uniref:hypothetical protein n=1 Tax=Micromonospora sp. CPCC 205556 TaxID=3122398 RepID=UPI002FF00DA5